MATTERRRRPAGERTHQAILDTAMRLASIDGINGVTIGRLADELGVSKSGLYAHFESKLDLQLQTIQAAIAVFVREVIEPAMRSEPGIERLQGFAEAYLSYVERKVFPGGCFFAGVIPEVDAQHGPVHDELVRMARMWDQLMEQTAREAQEREEMRRDVDPSLLVFQMYAAIELGNYYSVLFDDPQQIERARRAVRATLDAVRAV